MTFAVAARTMRQAPFHRVARSKTFFRGRCRPAGRGDERSLDRVRDPVHRRPDRLSDGADLASLVLKLGGYRDEDGDGYGPEGGFAAFFDAGDGRRPWRYAWAGVRHVCLWSIRRDQERRVPASPASRRRLPIRRLREGISHRLRTRHLQRCWALGEADGFGDARGHRHQCRSLGDRGGDRYL